MDGLAAIVWNLITETNGAPAAVWAAVCEHIQTDPGMLLDAWDELADLGSDAKPHVKAQVTQAQQLVNDVLHAIGDAAGDRGRDLGPVPRALVVLTARELAEYKRGRRATSRAPRRGRPAGRPRVDVRIVGGGTRGGTIALHDGDVIIVGTSNSPYAFKFRAG